MTYKVAIFLIALALATISLVIRTSDAVALSANIVAAWLMDEGKGTEIKDSSKLTTTEVVWSVKRRNEYHV